VACSPVGCLGGNLGGKRDVYFRRKPEAFRGIGFDNIKRDVAIGGVQYLGIGEVRDQAKEWAEEQEAKRRKEQAAADSLEAKRFLIIRRWTIVAAGASVVAAITGVIALFR
jgi:hypothetical protein